MNIDLKDLSCTLLPGKWNILEKPPSLYEAAYRVWRRTWADIFTQAGSPESLAVDNFLRQDAVIVLHRESQVVGLVTSTLLNLAAENSREHSYLKPFPNHIVQTMQQLGAGILTTGEYLSVEPEFRKSFTDIPIAEILVGLCTKIFEHLDGEVALATTVRPLKLHRYLAKHGYQEVGNFQKYGLDCLLLANTKTTFQTHPSSEVRAVVDNFWSRRRDLTGLTHIAPMSAFRKAA